MKSPLAFTGVLLIAGCQTPTPVLPPIPPGGDGCNVSISFGSYAMGIDQEAYARVETWLANHKALVADVKITPWGREGERTVCVTATSTAAIDPVFRGVTEQLPRLGKKAPISVLSETGGVFVTDGGPGA